MGGVHHGCWLEVVNYSFERLVNQPDPSRLAGTDGEALRRQRERGIPTHPAGQKVGPALRPIQAHILVVRVEDGPVTLQDPVRAEGQHDAASAGGPADGCDDQLLGTGDDSLAYVVDRHDVFPGLVGWVRRPFDNAEVDAVGEWLPSTEH